MATFLMLGKYSAEGLKGASSARTKTAVAALEKAEGKSTPCMRYWGNMIWLLLLTSRELPRP